MSKFMDRVKRVTPNEWILIGVILVLLVLIFRRWGWIWKEASDRFQISLDQVNNHGFQTFFKMLKINADYLPLSPLKCRYFLSLPLGRSAIVLKTEVNINNPLL